MNKIKIPKNYDFISAFITMRCNLNCSFCLNEFSSNQFSRNSFEEISGKQWVKALNRIESRPDVPITFSGGEIFMHKDFIYIINNLKPELDIDILTNLQWGRKGIERFIEKVDPDRIKRDSPYASIRVSYHPEQMGNGKQLVKNTKILQDAGFSIGIWSVLYPSPKQLSAINQMQFRCRDAGIDFRVKEFTGIFKGEPYGDYSKYSGACFAKKTFNCMCKTFELTTSPNGDVYKCCRDLYCKENAIGNILDKDFQIEEIFRPCNHFGECHPCDVKVKTTSQQKLGYISKEIKHIKHK